MSNTEDLNRPVTGYPAPPRAETNGYPPHPPPGSTAYPYAAGPPPSNPFHNYPSNPYYPQGYQYDPESARRATCLRRIFAFVISVVVIFGTVTLIVWLVLRPQIPVFRVNSLSISNFSLGNNSLVSFTSEIRLTVRNPNKKMTIAYDHIEAVIFYKSEPLSETTVPPFLQFTRNETSVTASFAAAGRFLDRSVADEMNSDRSRSGNVEFNLRMLSRVWFEAKAWRTRRRLLKVSCRHLTVGIPINGTLIGGPQQCHVRI